jgi:hypothetical protein
MHLRPGVVSEQSPQLAGRELLIAILLKGKRFQCCTGQVLALGLQMGSDVLGEFKKDPRRWSLTADLFKVLEPRQPLNGLAALFLSQPQLVQVLKIQPELGARSKKMCEA